MRFKHPPRGSPLRTTHARIVVDRIVHGLRRETVSEKPLQSTISTLQQHRWARGTTFTLQSTRASQEDASHIGPYEILERVAVGGMAEVLLARARCAAGASRLVIVKRVRERYLDDAEFLTMFLDEARLMTRLVHPYIAQVYDVGQTEDSWYIAMEYVHGMTLRALVAAARRAHEIGLPEIETACIGVAVTEALSYVHGRQDEEGRPLRVVPRDINPTNVLLARHGCVKLIDFGVAKAASSVHKTRIGMLKGTRGYVAPEQAFGEHVDHRADIFAIGVLLYELLIGRRPFDAGEPSEALLQAMRADYVRPGELRPGLAPGLRTLIHRCLRPDPDERPQQMQEVTAVLTAWLARRRVVPTLGRLKALYDAHADTEVDFDPGASTPQAFIR